LPQKANGNQNEKNLLPQNGQKPKGRPSWRRLDLNPKLACDWLGIYFYQIRRGFFKGGCNVPSKIKRPFTSPTEVQSWPDRGLLHTFFFFHQFCVKITHSKMSGTIRTLSDMKKDKDKGSDDDRQGYYAGGEHRWGKLPSCEYIVASNPLLMLFLICRFQWSTDSRP
jgi:hypothetical protein